VGRGRIEVGHNIWGGGHFAGAGIYKGGRSSLWQDMGRPGSLLVMSMGSGGGDFY